MTYNELIYHIQKEKTRRGADTTVDVIVSLLHGAEEVATYKVSCLNTVTPGHQCEGILDYGHLVLMVDLSE